MAKNKKPTPQDNLDLVRDQLAERFAADIDKACFDVATRLDDLSREGTDADRRKQLGEASRHILSYGKDMQAAVRRSVTKIFDGRLAGNESAAIRKAAAFTLDSLTLQDDIDVQQDITLNDVARRLKESCDFEFFSLTMRLQTLAGREHFADPDNPVLPRVFCVALLEGLTAINAPAGVRLDVFTMFQSDLTRLLPGIYHDANKLLIERQVMPDIVESYGKPVQRASRAPQMDMGGGGGGGYGGGGGGGFGVGGGGGGGSGSGVSTGDLAALFQRMAGVTAAAPGAGAAANVSTGAAVPENLAQVLAQLAGGLAETRERLSGLDRGSATDPGMRAMQPLRRFNRTFVGSIAFLDIIGFSKKTVSDQEAIKDRFNQILAQAIAAIPSELRLTLDTGDGAALGFLGDPEDALYACMRMRQLMAGLAEGVAFEIRAGINLGPVKLVKDVNGQANLIGDGINASQRIMSFAAAGQVAVSRSYFDVVSVMCDEYANLFTLVGDQADKHARDHTVYLLAESPAAFARAEAGVAERAEQEGAPAQAAEPASGDFPAIDTEAAEDGAEGVVVDASFLTAINRLQAGWTLTPPGTDDNFATTQHMPATSNEPSEEHAGETQRLPNVVQVADWDAAEHLAADASPDQTLRLPSIARAVAADVHIPTVVLPAVSPLPPAENLLHQVKESLAPQMSPVSAAVTDLLATLFDQILADEKIPQAAKSLIAQLQLPALKAAIIDVNLLTDHSHPLRVLIDRIALLGEQHGAALKPGLRLFQGLRAVVATVEEKFGGELDVIESALAELDVLLEAEETADAAETEAAVKKIEREEREQQAEDSANREVVKRLRAYRYPDVVDIFVTVAWRQVLRHDYLEGGTDAENAGEAWQRSLTTLNALLWSVRPDIVADQRDNLTRLIPALSARLHAGLDRIGVPPAGRTMFFDELVELHRLALKMPTAPARKSKETPPPKAAPAPTETAAPDPAPVDDDKQWPASPPVSEPPAPPVSSDSPEMKRGQWIQLRIIEEDWHACKLTWVSPSGENFVFKDFNSKAAFTMSAFDLKNKLRSGDARLVEESSLTQRSIDGAVADLARKLGG